MDINELIDKTVNGVPVDDLRRVYQERQERFALLSLELNRRRKAGRIHLPAAEAPVTDAGPHQRMIIGPELGFDIYNFHIFTSGRAAGSDRYHTHGDAVKYYVAGAGFEIIGDQRFEVNVGDVMHVPANVWHGTENPNNEPLIFLAVQQFPGTFRQVPTPFLHAHAPHLKPPDVQDLSDAQLRSLEPWPLYLLYMEQQVALGRALLEIQRRRAKKRVFVPAKEAPMMQWGAGRHPIIAPELGFDVYSVQVFCDVIAAGTVQGPVTGGETVKYCLAGEASETVGDQAYLVRKGDFLFVPAGLVNQSRNTGAEPLRYLCWQQLPGTFQQVPTPVLAVV